MRPEATLDAALEQTRTYHAALDTERLADTLQDLVATRRQSLWLICRYLADMADIPSCASIGYDDVFHFAWKELAMKRRTVRERVRVGRALRHLPAIEEAFVLGRVGFGRVREIVRVAMPQTEDYWLQAALDLPMRHLEALVAEAGGDRPTRHAPQTRELHDGLVEVRLVVPADVWAQVEDALSDVAGTEGEGLTQAEALARLAECARAFAASRARPSPSPGDPKVGVGDPGGGTDAGGDPIGSPEPRFRIRTSGAARDCPGGPTLKPAPEPEPGLESGVDTIAKHLSPAARAMLEVMDRRRKWGPDQLGDEAGIRLGQEIAVALAELEMAGCLEKVAGGYRVVPRHRRPRG